MDIQAIETAMQFDTADGVVAGLNCFNGDEFDDLMRAKITAQAVELTLEGADEKAGLRAEVAKHVPGEGTPLLVLRDPSSLRAFPRGGTPMNASLLQFDMGDSLFRRAWGDKAAAFQEGNSRVSVPMETSLHLIRDNERLRGWAFPALLELACRCRFSVEQMAAVFRSNLGHFSQTLADVDESNDGLKFDVLPQTPLITPLEWRALQAQGKLSKVTRMNRGDFIKDVNDGTMWSFEPDSHGYFVPTQDLSLPLSEARKFGELLTTESGRSIAFPSMAARGGGESPVVFRVGPRGATVRMVGFNPRKDSAVMAVGVNHLARTAAAQYAARQSTLRAGRDTESTSGWLLVGLKRLGLVS